MAKPIKETPVLTGEDAVRFEEASHEVKPVSQEEIQKAQQAFEYFASIANFSLS